MENKEKPEKPQKPRSGFVPDLPPGTPAPLGRGSAGSSETLVGVLSAGSDLCSNPPIEGSKFEAILPQARLTASTAATCKFDSKDSQVQLPASSAGAPGIGKKTLNAAKEEAEGVVELLHCWKNRDYGSSPSRISKDARMCVRPDSMMHDVETEECDMKPTLALDCEYVKTTSGFWGRVISSPNSPKRAIWDILSLLMVVYDMIMIPFQLMEPADSHFGFVMAWVTRVFWTFDLPISFTSGFLTKDGLIEMRLRRIAFGYLKTWFILDIVIVGGDWLELIFGVSSGQAYARVGKSSRTIRIIRMVRLLRMLRVWQVVADFVERLQSEKVYIITHIVKIVGVIAFWAHIGACVWYGVGLLEEHDGNTWIQVYEYAPEDASLTYRYLTSAHWALSMFTGGMDEVTPQNPKERIFCIVLFLVAFVMAAAFTSSLTSSMTRLHILTSGQSKQLSMLRRYLVQNHVPNRLALRIQRNAQLGVLAKHIPENSVELLHVISDPLKVELHYEMYNPVFVRHPFFQRYNRSYPHVMRQICHFAARLVYARTGDAIFNAGDSPLRPKMYIVRDGAMQFITTEGERIPVPEGGWASEPALWIRWTHCGRLDAVEDGSLLEIDAKAFQDIVPLFEHPLFSPYVYAEQYLELIRSRRIPFLDVMTLPLHELVESNEALQRSGSNVVKKTVRGSKPAQVHPLVAASVAAQAAAPASAAARASERPS